MSSWKRNVWILFVCQFLVLGAMTMIMPFLPLYLQELGVAGKEVSIWAGFIFGANFFTAFLFSPFWGRMADRHGRKLMILRSGFGMAVVIILTGFATGPVSLLLLRLLNGVISGFIPASIALVATNTPKKHVGYALGTLNSGAVAGAICGPLFGGIMAESFGFRMIFNITGVCILIAAIVVLMFVKEESIPTSQKEKTNAVQDFKRVTGNSPILSLFVVGFLIQFALLGMNPLIPLFVQKLTDGQNVALFAGIAPSVMGFANMIVSPKLGKLGDQKGSQNVLYYTLIGAAAFSIPQAFVVDLWQLIALRFMLGLCIGGLLPSVNSLIKKLAPEGMESRTYGFSNSAVYLGNMLGPVIGGWLASMAGTRALFLFGGAILLINVVFVKWKVLPELGRQNKPYYQAKEAFH
ncbi:MFS transporter [Pseudalkalibacillus caeni]|uniref:Multidrug efflux MFS transporter n=1 Tax=Exobacillus caeni TaxID=2574798 RepID=A0A5R9F5G9_9BACL|nr:MFS transporter [Pseudalkalibacillus caeni]TLS37650.1 multidrug efflux MFS transporter [Pseudalkalibacillus caeni]